MKINKIDHVHIYVDDINLAESWYKRVLGFYRDESLYFWFEQGGPLILKNDGVSLALFKRDSQHPGHTVAFEIHAKEMTTLINNLNINNINYNIGDHEVSMSVYFCDINKNKFEFTSYEYTTAKYLLKDIKNGSS